MSSSMIANGESRSTPTATAAATGISVLLDDVSAGVATAELRHHAAGLGTAAVLAIDGGNGVDLAGEVVRDAGALRAAELIDRHGHMVPAPRLER